MSIDARLHKLMPVLTAQERAILVLRSYRDKTPEDPLVRNTMPREKATQFNHYICLLNACTIYLPMYITMVEQQIEQLLMRLMWLESVLSQGKSVWELGKLIPAGKRIAAEEVVSTTYPRMELPWDGQEHPDSWLNFSERMDAKIRHKVTSLCQELGSIDVILDEVAAELNGEDPLGPVMRTVMEATRNELALLYRFLGAPPSESLPQPDEESLILARKYFDNGYRMMAGI